MNTALSAAPVSERRIREALLAHLLRLHRGDRELLVIEELVVASGAARVDVAVANGALHGYSFIGPASKIGPPESPKHVPP